MFLYRRNICFALWKNTTKSFRQLDTCCQPVIKSKSYHLSSTSRLPIVGCECKDVRANKYSNQSVRSTRYLWPYSTRIIHTSAGRTGVTVTGHSISSRLAADRAIREMTEEERNFLTQALSDLHEEFRLESDHVDDKPTAYQLWLTAWANSVPFIGFGFLDNAIMIAAGEYIDITVGAAFGISTMAAAAIGNMISDVCGIGLAGYVEVLAARLGIEEPHLTAHQLMMKSTKIAAYSGRAAGIIIGCLIGMFPLFFLPGRECDHEHEHEQKSDDKIT